jgi:hypothetical protein
MSEIEIQKLDRKTKETARLYYFGNYSIEDIAEIMKVDINTIRFYVFGENGAGSNESCWYQLKKQLNPASVALYVHDKIKVLEKTAGVALNILNENLMRIQRQMQDDPSHMLNMDDTKKLAGIVTDMDKIVRLESGKATSITENIGLTRAEAIRVLQEDPFAQSVEVEEAEWWNTEPDETLSLPDSIEANVTEDRPWK